VDAAVSPARTSARAAAGAPADGDQGAARGGAQVSAQPRAASSGTAETIASFLAAVSIFASCIAVAYRPGRVIPFALLLALLAAGIGGRATRLAAWAIAVGGVCFIVGMAVAVLTDNPIF
jgi:hypothetical protein